MTPFILSILAITICLRYIKLFQLDQLSRWILSLAFLVKIIAGFIFMYIYIYKNNTIEPSDAMRFLEEGKQLHNVFYTSKSDYLYLLTGTKESIIQSVDYMKNTFLWNAGDFTFINDSRNIIRIHSLIYFISNGNELLHLIIINIFSLIGITQLFLALKKFTDLKPIILFYCLLFIPSLLFWGSSILKEPFIILGIGLLSRGLLSEIVLNKKITLIILGSLTLIAFKPYILICLIPVFIFHIVYKNIFKYDLIKTIFLFITLSLISLFIFSNKSQKIVEYISRKQFDLINVGEGGVHVYSDKCYYYFTPNLYNNIKIHKDSVELIHPSKAYLLSIDRNEKPTKISLNKVGEKWKIHIMMPGTNSFFKTKRIDNSPIQLILNIPEALINAILRPFPFDKGSILKIPTMLEAWGVFLFLILSFIFKKKNIQKKEVGIISSLLIFAILLFLLIGWTTPITGAIVRFRFPAQLALVIIGIILIDYKRIKIKKHE